MASVADVLKQAQKDFGDDIGNDNGEYYDVERIPTGIFELDLAMGGGFPRRRVSIVYGNESSTKTVTCMLAIANHQRLWPDQKCAFIGLEGIDKPWFKQLGVDIDKVYWFEPTFAEQVVDIIESLCYAEDIGLIVLDSIAAMMTTAEHEKSATQATMGGAGIPISKMVRKTTAALNKAKGNPTIIYINQVRCVDASTRVFTDLGLVTAKDALKASKIAGLPYDLTAIGGSDVSVQTGVAVTLSDGRRLVSGPEHPLLVYRGAADWCKAKEVSDGDFVAVALPKLVEVNSDVPLEMCQFLGMWFSDGSIISSRDKCLSFTENSLERRKAVVDQAALFGWSASFCGASVIRFNKAAHDHLVGLGCQRGGPNKTIPACITGKEQWRYFLRGMFDHHFNRHGLVITVENEDAARHIQTALLGFHILSRLKFRGSTGYIHITGEDGLRYASEIGFSEPSKQKILEDLCSNSHPSARGKADVIPLDKALIMQARAMPAWAQQDAEFKQRVTTNLCANHALARRDYLKLCEVAEASPDLARWHWFRVTDVSETGEREMIDFDVPDGEAFIADGFVTHNTKIGVMYGDSTTMPGGSGIKFQSAMTLKLYGKNEMDTKINKVMPVRKSVSAVIQKWKVPIVAVKATYEVAMIPHKGLLVGQSDYFNTFLKYGKALGMIEKSDKSSVWGVAFGEEFQKQSDLKDMLYSDPKFASALCHDLVKALTENNEILQASEDE